MGRAKKPTAMKIFDGNPGKRRIESDDYQAAGAPIKPRGMVREAIAMWDMIVPDLVAKSVAKQCDTPALILLCEWWGRYATASMRLRKDPDNWQLITIASMAAKHFERLASRFGLTPSARASLKLSDDKNDDAINEFVRNAPKCSKR